MKLIGEKEFLVRGIRIHSNKEEVASRMGRFVSFNRDPENYDDENAIEVLMKNDGQQIGYVSREEAAILAPILDEYSSEIEVLTYQVRLVYLYDSMTTVVRAKCFYDDQTHIDLCGNTMI